MSAAIVPYGAHATSDQMPQPDPERIKAMFFNQGAPGAYVPRMPYPFPSGLSTGNAIVPYQSGGPSYDAWKDIPYSNRAYGVPADFARARSNGNAAVIAVTGTVISAVVTAMCIGAYMKDPQGQLSTVYLVLAISCGCCTALIGLIGTVRYMS